MSALRTLSRTFVVHGRSFLGTASTTHTSCQPRCFSTDDPDNLSKKIPALMNFPCIVWPNLRHALRNWFFAKTVITPFFDNEYSNSDFAKGAKIAIEVVSEAFATGDFEDLEDYVDHECLKEIKKNISLFSMKQRQALAVKSENIYMSFLYQIGIIMEEEKDHYDDELGTDRRHVEITFVAHTYPEYMEIVKYGELTPAEVARLIQEDGGPIVLNYRFIREFTKGVKDHWKINAINHFLLSELNS